MARLVLIGTVHLDPDGHRMLRGLLDSLGPVIVTVEVSPYALEFRQTKGPELLARLDPFRLPDGSLPSGLQAVAAQLEIPYEYGAAKEHSDRTGTAVVPVGDSEVSRRLLKDLEQEVLSRTNLEKLALRDLPPLSVQVNSQRAQAAKLIRKGPLVGTRDRARLDEVDIQLAVAVREHLGIGVTVHVGGWEHLCGLSRRLADLDPEVRLPDGVFGHGSVVL